jgi:hypothetical protein
MPGPPTTSPKMSLTNMRSQDSITAQCNPEDLDRAVAVAYARVPPLGYSSEVLQFQFRPNEKLTFTMTWDRLATGGCPSFFVVEGILDAMTVGSRSAQDIASGGPPDVLMIWPGVLQMIVRVTSIKWTIKRYANSSDGSPTFFAAKVDVEESRSNRLYAEDIRSNGLSRSGS